MALDEPKHPGGRPTDYREEYNLQAEKLCKLGATDKELADFFEVTEQTINNWKDAHPGFFESIKAGKTLADANVASRLYERAMGFEHDSEEIKVVEGTIERVPTRKIYPPDSTAAIFWLKNRQKDKWRDKTEQEHSGGDKPLRTEIHIIRDTAASIAPGEFTPQPAGGTESKETI